MSRVTKSFNVLGKMVLLESLPEGECHNGEPRQQPVEEELNPVQAIVRQDS